MEKNVLFSNPRPDLERENCMMLTGPWDFSASSDGSVSFDRTIEVPFPPESKLSGIGRITMPEDTIVYRRHVKIEKEEGKRYLLNFLAVDHECTVLINGRAAGHHTGGFLPFTFDITDLITTGDTEIRVMVTDPTDTMEIERGKQSLHPHQIWYGPVSGIWQPVWLETVTDPYITRMMVTPHIETDELEFLIATSRPDSGTALLTIDNTEKEVPLNRPFRLKLDDPHLWSPEDPYLYCFSILYQGETVKSYTAMRSFGVGPDENGNKRLLLNGRPYFHNGVLDQGWWQDSLMTPPSDRAMEDDIVLMKEMGFNMLRKHIKVESPRWYYYAAKHGMLVWQDAPNGGGDYRFPTVTVPLFLGSHLSDTGHRKAFARNSTEEMKRWEDMLEEMVMHLYSQPAVAMWVIFNEGWGQFDSGRMREKVLALDSTRTIDATSGWQDQGGGDFLSRHIYFRPYRYREDKHGRAVLLSEFGGYGLDLDAATEKKGMFSYRKIGNSDELASSIEELYERDVISAIPKGLAAAVYTQLSDVESEKNGLVTYDRKTVKVDRARIRKLNGKVRI